LPKKNHDLIEKHNFFEELQLNNDWFCGVWLGQGLVLQLGKTFHGIREQFPHKLFCFGFCLCWVCYGRLGCTLVSFFL
jgi:hypothetical protein